ncbi:MAG: hypothetical protein LQ346_006509, partial [Caloplaca aetnensis]
FHQTPASQENEGFWTDLHPNLVPPNAATTLILISKGRVRYYAKKHRWTHLGLARTVLGCVDEKYVRDRDRGHEWYLLEGQLHDTASNQTWNLTAPSLVNGNNTPYSDREFTVLQLLCLALRFSDTASAIGFVRNKWLDADSRVVDFPEGLMSLPLDPHQWRLEAQRLFNVSLARMQIEITEMTRPRSIQPEEDVLENFFRSSPVDPCAMIMINADGWRNISVIGFASMLLLALGLWLVTMEIGDTIVLIWLYQMLVKPGMKILLRGLQYVGLLAVEGFHVLIHEWIGPSAQEVIKLMMLP